MDVFTKQSQEGLNQIKEALLHRVQVRVHADYETLYGIGFDSWLRQGLQSINCTIEVKGYNPWYGYPDTFIVTPII